MVKYQVYSERFELGRAAYGYKAYEDGDVINGEKLFEYVFEDDMRAGFINNSAVKSFESESAAIDFMHKECQPSSYVLSGGIIRGELFFVEAEEYDDDDPEDGFLQSTGMCATYAEAVTVRKG